MAELTCALSAVVFAELYQLLAKNRDGRDALDDRLVEIGYDSEWLSDAAAAYRAKWQYDAQYIDADSADSYALSEEHAILATWILAGLRNDGDCYQLAADLRDAVVKRLAADAPALVAVRPQSMAPIIRGWTLGLVAGTLDPLVPVVPAVFPQDENIAEAYRGLVDHVLHLGALGESWPELVGTALYVRTGGLAEALRPAPPPPPQRGLSYSVSTLVSESRRQVPLHIFSRLTANFDRWVPRRNVLTHVRPSEDGTTFADSASLVRTWDQIEMTVMGITQFICQEVSLELFDSIPSALRNDPWDYLKREIQTEW